MCQRVLNLIIIPPNWHCVQYSSEIVYTFTSTPGVIAWSGNSGRKSILEKKKVKPTFIKKYLSMFYTLTSLWLYFNLQNVSGRKFLKDNAVYDVNLDASVVSPYNNFLA